MWSYEGTAGPRSWGCLDPAYATCDEGREQSPVDIPPDAPVHADDTVYAYRESAVAIHVDDVTIRVDYNAGSWVRIDRVDYALQQFHFHAPSEHTVAGRHRELEMHLVHSDADGNIVVIGVFLVRGTENQAFASVLTSLSDEGGPVATDGAVVDAGDLLPADRSYVAYRGSLTTPPCTEGVRWHVLRAAVELSADQLRVLHRFQYATNRPVQPMNDRAFK